MYFLKIFAASLQRLTGVYDDINNVGLTNEQHEEAHLNGLRLVALSVVIHETLIEKSSDNFTEFPWYDSKTHIDSTEVI